MATTTYIVTREIADVLRATRIKQKKSQSQVARDLNASQTTIQKIEIGQAKESSFLKELWLYYALPADQFEELQNSVNRQGLPARREVAPNIASADHTEQLSDATLGQIVRRLVREELIRTLEILRRSDDR